MVVGERVGTSDNLFLIPRDFLQRRSQTFRKQIEQHDSTILIPDTTVPTLTEFFIWSHSRKPQLEEGLTFDNVVNLGIYAYKYEIAALSNQVTDLIRASLASGEWELQAGVVDAIYQAAPVNSPLREVVKAALGKLPRASIDGEEWEKAFNKNSGLGWDCHKAGDKEWNRQEYLSGVCRYHNHDGIKRQEGLCDGCPYAEADCYPEWDDDHKQEQEVEPLAEELPSAPEPATAPHVEDTVTEVTVPEPDEAVPEEPIPEPQEATPEPKKAIPEPEEATPEPEGPAPWEPDFVAPEPEEPEVAKTNGEVRPADDYTVDMNGHAESDEPEDAIEGSSGTETPHVSMTREASQSEELPSKSLHPELHSSDKENGFVPKMNGNVVDDKNKESVTVTESPKMSKKAKKKAKRAMSISHPN